MDNSKDEKVGKKLLSKDTYHITIKNDAIDKQSIEDNNYLLETLNTLIKRRRMLIYLALSLYIIHIISIIVFVYRVITIQYMSDGEFIKELIIVFAILFGSIVMLLGSLIFCKTHYVTLQYHMDETSRQTVDTNISAFEILSQCKKVWGVSGYNVGSYSTIHPIRKDAQLQFKSLPWFLKSNIDKCYQLDVGNESYYFLPEKILIDGKKGITSAYYSQIDIKLDKTAIAETGRVPCDAMFVRNTWERTNKDGSPDKRVKNNKQIPEYVYGVIYFRGDRETNLNLRLYCSDIRKAVDAMKILSSTNTYKEDEGTNVY